jgi:hypothetical protein
VRRRAPDQGRARRLPGRRADRRGPPQPLARARADRHPGRGRRDRGRGAGAGGPGGGDHVARRRARSDPRARAVRGPGRGARRDPAPLGHRDGQADRARAVRAAALAPGRWPAPSGPGVGPRPRAGDRSVHRRRDHGGARRRRRGLRPRRDRRGGRGRAAGAAAHAGVGRRRLPGRHRQRRRRGRGRAPAVGARGGAGVVGAARGLGAADRRGLGAGLPDRQHRQPAVGGRRDDRLPARRRQLPRRLSPLRRRARRVLMPAPRVERGSAGALDPRSPARRRGLPGRLRDRATVPGGGPRHRHRPRRVAGGRRPPDRALRVPARPTTRVRRRAIGGHRGAVRLPVVHPRSGGDLRPSALAPVRSPAPARLGRRGRHVRRSRLRRPAAGASLRRRRRPARS